ncbi:peptidase S8/S53 domain-containing protein [Mycena rebaudengoi]|nr:peptidase S8/S53 domain-containing protein [Mycena rebaudengoi]
MRTSINTLVSVALFFTSTLAISGSVLHEKRDHIPHGWSHHSKYPSDSVIPLRIGLVQPNLDAMGDLLNEVSHPDSPSYGKHWTPKMVIKKFAPSWETVDAVRGWLVDHGISKERIQVTSSRIWIELLNSTVAEVEDLLNTEYNLYEHDSGKKHVASMSYSVPADLQHHIDIITPTVHFDVVPGKQIPQRESAQRARAPSPGLNPGSGIKAKPIPAKKILAPSNQAVAQGTTSQNFYDLARCDTQITPVCLRALYGLNNYTLKAVAKNSYGIVEYTPQAYVPDDLDTFAAIYAPDLVGKRPVVVSIDGGSVQTDQTGFDYNGESNLDLQYGMALVTGAQPVQLYQVGDTVSGASFNNFLDAIDGSYCTYAGGDDPFQDVQYPNPSNGGYKGPKACGTVTPARVISTSYAYNEADLTPLYMKRQCDEYAKLGLLGVTILFSSGDNGVGGNGGLCIDNSGGQSTSGKIFNPSFPSGCPYITSIGATQVMPGRTVLNPESACKDVIHSGGGFSKVFDLPDFQKTQVNSYFAANPPKYSASLYNPTGVPRRAFPDISANGANYVVTVQGQNYLVYGTSASSPVVGSILTLINDARLHLNKSPIGFINPTIYSAKFAGAWNDVVNGTNPGCGTNGWSAVKGWDPVTGLGTPNFPKLLKAWTELL